MIAVTSPIRVLHALGCLDRGGIETWLVQILRHADRERFRMDFLVHSMEAGAYDGEVRALGSNVIPCRPTGLRRPWSYATYPRELRSILNRHGPYDVVHAHLQEFSGYVLRAAAKAGVRARIAHSHTSTPPAECQPGPVRRASDRRRSRWVRRYATLGLACSRLAARSLYGEQWESDGRFRILNYGIDLAPFLDEVDAERERSRLGIPAGARVVGHVGRFVPPKNHAFLVEVIAECVKRRRDVHFLLIGDGPLRPHIQRAIDDRGLSENVVFAGTRGDVPRLMLSAMDLFVFPSLWEGLGNVQLEAQAAGLPLLVSEHLPDEAGIIPGRIERLRLADGPKLWAERILRRLAEETPDRQEALEMVARSPFALEESAQALLEVYERSLPPESAAGERGQFGADTSSHSNPFHR